MFDRIRALIVRNLTLTFRGIDPLIDVFYWPLFDLVLWGLTSKVMQIQMAGQLSLLWLTGLVLWQACWRSNLDICFNLLGEIWSRNVVNLFATPLELLEWVISAMAVGFIDACITVLYGGLVAYLLFGVNIFSVGWIFIPLFFLLLLAGWTIGFFSAGWLIYSGQKVQKVVWVLGWFFVPFSGIFVPITLLPAPVLVFAKMLPMTHAYEGLRMYVTQGTFPTLQLAISLALNILYLTLSLSFFKMMFQKSKEKGLSRLEAE